MDNKKDNSYYLKRIIKDLVFILEHTKGITQEQLEENEILIDSVMFRLIQIAEIQTNSLMSSKHITMMYHGER